MSNFVVLEHTQDIPRAVVSKLSIIRIINRQMLVKIKALAPKSLL